MSLSWLVPGALLVTAWVGLPILAHLSRRMPTERVAFGAMPLLRRLTRRLRRRQRVRDPWILLLRALALAALGLAAAGPVARWQAEVPVTEGLARHVLIVDRSRSVGLADGGATLLARALGEARSWLSSQPPGFQAGVVLCGSGVDATGSELTDDLATLAARLVDVQPALGACDLGAAVLEARRLLGDEPGAVHVFSDEAGPVMIPQAQEEIRRLVEAGHALVPRPVRAEVPRNILPVHAAWEEGLEGGRVIIRVRGQGPRTREVPCEVDLPDGGRIRVFVTVPPDGEAQTAVTVPRDSPGGVGVVHCEDPDLPLDDRRWFHLPGRQAREVVVVDGDPGDTPTRSEVYFLERALAPWGGSRDGVSVRVVGVTGLPELDPEQHAAVFLANVGDPRPFGLALRSYVRDGGTLVIGLGANVVAERYAASLGPLLPSPLDASVALADREEEPVRLTLPDTRLPELAPLARGGRMAVTRIGSHRIFRLEPYAEGGGVQTLLRYEGGAPALVSRQVGRGRVYLWTSSFDLHWTNFPLQSAFLPLMQQLAGGAGLGQVATAEGLVDERVSVAVPDDVRRVWVQGPGGVEAAAEVSDKQATFLASRPGAWEVRVPDGPVIGRVAVNLDPVEGDVMVRHTLREAGVEASPSLFERQAEVAPWLLWAALVLWAGAAVWAARPAPPEAEDGDRVSPEEVVA